MRAYLFRCFVTILCGIVFAFSLFGCGTYEYVTVQSSYLSASAKILPDPTAILPTRAQDEADKRRLALPPELRERLQALVAQTWNERPNPRYIGDYASDIQGLNNKIDRLLWSMTLEALRWAAEKTPEERAAQLQVRQLQPLPPVKVEAPPIVDEPITLAHPVVQAGGGFVSGLAIGPVPFGPTAADVGIQLIKRGGGSGEREKFIPTPGGKKSGRRPDIVYQKPGEPHQRGRNVGKTNADGTPVKREQEALDDLNNHSDTPTDFTAYDR